MYWLIIIGCTLVGGLFGLNHAVTGFAVGAFYCAWKESMKID